MQLSLNLKELGVDIISLIEKNVHWKRNHVIARFKMLLKKVWPNNTITYSTSETKTACNTYCKPDETATVSIDKLLSSIIAKSEDSSGMEDRVRSQYWQRIINELQSSQCIDHSKSR